MEPPKMQIIMKQDKRPCVIFNKFGDPKNVLWHLFYKDKAFIEYDDGTTAWVTASRVNFLDSKSQFAEYDWGDEK